MGDPAELASVLIPTAAGASAQARLEHRGRAKSSDAQSKRVLGYHR